jgi:hypothetical protein
MQLSALVCLPYLACIGQTHFATSPTRFLVCDKGNGEFNGSLPDSSQAAGVSAFVAAAKKNDFAIHACRAEIRWNGQTLSVAPEVEQADIDVMGADLGLGSLVVAFQIKASADDPHIQYKIYSLTQPPQLLRTITGEDYFSAADTRLDGSVEIWTTDAAAINGFDGLPRSAFDVPPTVVLRFEEKKLIDVSSEFRPHFDGQIALLRSQLDAQQLSDFKNSDGKLSDSDPAAKIPPHSLLATKIKVLEIVWSYLASDREPEAWNALAEMWPASDLDRIRAAILDARARGMRSQVDGVSHKLPPPQTKHSFVYKHIAPPGRDLPLEVRAVVADSAPRRLVWMTGPPHNADHWAEGKELELLVDEAGKVRSAKMKKDKQTDEPNQEWIDASAGWKYIPAYKDAHPAAYSWKQRVRRNQ